MYHTWPRALYEKVTKTQENTTHKSQQLSHCPWYRAQTLSSLDKSFEVRPTGEQLEESKFVQVITIYI